MANEDIPPELIAEFLRRRGGAQAQAITGAPGINMGQKVADQLVPIPERQATPDMPDMGERPDVGKLYKMLSTVQGKPIDYSALEAVNKANQESARRDFLGGLALQMMGGKRLSGAGGQIFQQALAEGKPLRPNAADVGYINQETGEFVENPAAARAREEKMITGRIDALTKDEDKKAAAAIQQGRLDKEIAATQNANELKSIMAGIAQQSANTQQMVAQERMANARDKAASKGDLKELRSDQVKVLDSTSSAYQRLTDLQNSFSDDFAGKGLLGDAKVATAQALGSWGSKGQQAEAAWWANYNQHTLPAIKEIFGTSRSAGEEAALKAATQIKPGTDPAQVRTVMQDLQQKVYERHIRNSKNALLGKRDPSAFEIDPATMGINDDTRKKLPVKEVGGKIKPASALPKATGKSTQMSDDDLINKYLK